MKMKYFLLFFCLLILTVFFAWSQPGQYKIAGETMGFADSTMIYLDDLSASSPVHIDSTFIIHNRFNFSRVNKMGPVQVMISTKRYADYKFLWVENAAITFKAEKGKFREAVITGSATQVLEDRLNADIKRTGNEKEQSFAFIQNHPNSIISANLLSIYASTWGKDTATVLYRTLSPANKNTLYGKSILQFIMLNKNVKVGDQYVDFTEPDTAGKNVSLSDFKGKITLLEFWGSWCGPCRAGNPGLVKVYNEFSNRGFDILGVAADNDKKFWMEAIRKDSLSWKNVCDLKGDKNKAALIYGVSYYPTNFLIDKKGKIIAKDITGEDLRKKLHELLD